MSRYLSSLLGVDDLKLAHSIQKLEAASLHKSTDIRLSAEIRLGVRTKVAILGLDPSDTTAEELYLALRSKLRQDNHELAQIIGITKEHDSVTSLHKLAEYFANSSYPQEVWSIKRVVLKKLFSAHVPHKTMKALKYRSAASMFKRESAASIYATALLIEGKSYKEKLINEMRHLKPQDFEIRKIEVVSFAPAKWELIHKSLKRNIVPVYALPEANCVVVAPIKTNQTSGLVLLASALIITELYRVKMHASYLKVRSLDKELANAVQQLALNDKIHVATTQGIQITWSHVHRLLAANNELANIIGPHLTNEDIQWLSVESILTSISPQLDFWVDSHHLAFVSSLHNVSLHVIDVALNELYDLNVLDGSTSFVRLSVNDELLLRYLVLPPFSAIIEQYMQKLTDLESGIMYDET